MSKSAANELLARLAGQETVESNGDNPWKELEASSPTHQVEHDDDPKLASLLQRIGSLAASSAESAARPPQETVAEELDSAEPWDSSSADFFPDAPESFDATGLTESEVEALALKFLLSRGDCTGRDIADQVMLPFGLIEEICRHMKQDQLVAYRASAAMSDYVYQLTDLGRERARRHVEHCTYFGAAPVTLADYITSVKAQSLENQQPTLENLERAFSDLLINPEMMHRLGPAINSGRGMFLFGFPGNGKTSIAERVTLAFGETIWVPRAIGVDGEIIRLYDPSNHVPAPLPKNTGLLDQSRVDRRWVRIQRPTIVVGGELTMDNLEITMNHVTGINEAPMQLKSNCGTLVIDDFGRQRMSTDELLNRWIVPLEKRYDYLNLSSGKKIEVPFDQLLILSTNLEPRDLVDEAFLRRIPYKIEVVDPTEEEFRQLFGIMCPKMGFEYDDASIDYLIKRHYRETKRPFRCCQPRDLLSQVRCLCLFESRPLKLSPEAFDKAVENYFSVM